jgi:glyoxylase-like metal-dependent hydrolase (beta-lactamase superfamily II)
MRTPALLFSMLALAGCAVTGHAVQPSSLGTVSSTSQMLALIDSPGPVQLETVNSTDWEISLGGLLNLDNPKAKEAGLTDHPEPIQIYFHALRHPTKGLFIVDTGVEHRLRDAPGQSPMNGLVALFMKPDKMRFHAPLGDWLPKQGKLSGVMLTHAHIDHVSGMPDVPKGTPLYCGPGETSTTAFQNLFTRGTFDELLEGQEPLSEWQYAADPDKRFEGVIDVFGDGSVFAIWVPGHTVGSTAYLVRTPNGPVLLVGDTSHTAWGWEHEVEPGGYTADHAKNLENLQRLRKLVADHPNIDVRLGHQALHPAPPATGSTPVPAAAP